MSGYALHMAHQAGQAINDKMNGNDLLNPESMIKAQFALQQYSTFINYESSLIKMIKDMLSGIIAKI
ncbi:type III secretion system needle protein SsaG [Salmonella enterica subsp. enterica serovar Bareilly str. CFSAN000229]|nr:type III secretion system needle protein SsaG [Salmonella enterica subsp. enterica serovar Bareilly str. CFSAN000229]KGF84099.1 type III secretion system needle protein SsaG [Salmonella enterica subsp. enterica serovar Weltevreden]